jgi:uncharacterized OsmC-like protein
VTGTQTTIREATVRACSTDTFGRVLCSCRDHHFIVDGPSYNGCPGEEVTPTELFLSAVASCGVELVQVLAREQERPLGHVSVGIRGVIDRGQQPRADVTVFTAVRLRFELKGTDGAGGAALIQAFKRR